MGRSGEESLRRFEMFYVRSLSLGVVMGMFWWALAARYTITGTTYRCWPIITLGLLMGVFEVVLAIVARHAPEEVAATATYYIRGVSAVIMSGLIWWPLAAAFRILTNETVVPVAEAYKVWPFIGLGLLAGVFEIVLAIVEHARAEADAPIPPAPGTGT